ncbi:MAG: MtrB/PioB family outer membrane beta-barrel protein [Nitrospira sp.]|nr:MtrB/PioB family outer membrane beta-barrel protein [Nitrospira sp.]
MKKIFIILMIILFIPGIVLCEETSADSPANPAALPVSPPADAAADKPRTDSPANKPADTPAETDISKPEGTTPAEGTPTKEPPPESISSLEVSGNYQDLKIFKDSPKIKEYRTIPEGFYLDNIRFFSGSEHQEFSGYSGKLFPLTNISQDGYWNLNYKRYGLLDADMGLNKFIHEYGAPSADVSTRRDINNLTLKFTPGDKLIISTKLSVEERNGKRPLDVESLTNLTGGPPTAIIEITEPTDYKTTTIDLGMEYVDDSVDMQFGDSFQIFSNMQGDDIKWQNPFNGSDGRAKTAGDYTVHTLTLRPSIKLSENITSVNTLSYSNITSSIDLVPFTTVPNVGDPFLRNIVDSDVRNVTFSTALSAKLLSNVRFNIKYRHYAYKNDTPVLKDTPAYVMLDGGTGEKRYIRKPRYTAFYTDSIMLDSTWAPANRLFLNTSIENKDTSRDETEVKKQNEKKASVSLRSNISNALTGKIGYTYLRRRGNYDPTYYNTVYDPDPLNNITQNTLMRTFDLSELDSQYVSATVDYFPTGTLTAGLSASYLSDDHLNVIIGRVSSATKSGSLHLQFVPFAALQLYSEYYHDIREINGRYTWTYDSSLSYPNDPGNGGFVKPVTGTLNDTADVFVLGFNFEPQDLLSITGRYTKNNFTGTDTLLPDVSNITETYEIKVSSKIGREDGGSNSGITGIKYMKITAGYYMERYRQNDYALQNFVITGTENFLGIREGDYRFRTISLYLTMYF